LPRLGQVGAIRSGRSESRESVACFVEEAKGLCLLSLEIRPPLPSPFLFPRSGASPLLEGCDTSLGLGDRGEPFSDDGRLRCSRQPFLDRPDVPLEGARALVINDRLFLRAPKRRFRLSQDRSC
jgi:hypothetical protein